MTVLAFFVVAFVAYQFGRWVRRGNSMAAKYEDRKEIERLRVEVAELEDEIQQHEVEERTVAWQ